MSAPQIRLLMSAAISSERELAVVELVIDEDLTLCTMAHIWSKPSGTIGRSQGLLQGGP
jgi:hypothetical protein